MTNIIIKMRSLNILQINLNRSRAAHDLLENSVAEQKIDVVLVSEPNCRLAQLWITDDLKDVGIRIGKTDGVVEEARGKGNGFVWASINSVILYSCYFSPNRSKEEFEEFLVELEESVASQGKNAAIVIGGDFNAASTFWGSKRCDWRGRQLLEWMGRRDLWAANDGAVPTFFRAGQESFLDLTLCTNNLRDKIENWHVQENVETLSDHRYVCFNLKSCCATETRRCFASRWSGRNFNDIVANGEYRKRCVLRPAVSNGLVHKSRTDGATVQVGVLDEPQDPNEDDLMEILEDTCKLLAPKIHTRSRCRKPKYWWTTEIAEARKECVRTRRSFTREKSRCPGQSNAGDAEGVRDAAMKFRAARKNLKLLIKRSKERCWREICDEVEKDVWGLGYKIVTKKLGCALPMLTNGVERKIVGKLFPQHPDRVAEAVGNSSIQEF